MNNALLRLLMPCFCSATVSDGGGPPAITTTTTKIASAPHCATITIPKTPQTTTITTTTKIPCSHPHHRSPSSSFQPLLLRRRTSATTGVEVDGDWDDLRPPPRSRLVLHSTRPSLLETPCSSRVPHRDSTARQSDAVRPCRIALESDRSDLGSCPLRSVPVWTMFCNGRKLGFAVRRNASDRFKLMMKTMSSTTVRAGVMQIRSGSGFGPGSVSEEVIMRMRTNYEHMVGSAQNVVVSPD